MIVEGKMAEVHQDLQDHLDKHIATYKRNGGADALGSHCVRVGKKISNMHDIPLEHAHKMVNDYVDHALNESVGLEEMSIDTLLSAKEKALKLIQAKIKQGDVRTAAKHANFVHKVSDKLKEEEEEELEESRRGAAAHIVNAYIDGPEHAHILKSQTKRETKVSPENGRPILLSMMHQLAKRLGRTPVKGKDYELPSTHPDYVREESLDEMFADQGSGSSDKDNREWKKCHDAFMKKKAGMNKAAKAADTEQSDKEYITQQQKKKELDESSTLVGIMRSKHTGAKTYIWQNHEGGYNYEVEHIGDKKKRTYHLPLSKVITHLKATGHVPLAEEVVL